MNRTTPKPRNSTKWQLTQVVSRASSTSVISTSTEGPASPTTTKAYQWYSLAAALAPSSEAVYKLGDMFGRGRAVPQDKSKAYRLYERSLELARDDVEFAQPAIRIAAMLIDPDAPSCGIDVIPYALTLYQRTEIGLRIEHRQRHRTYYTKRLREAIEAKTKARKLVEMDDL